MHRVHIDYLATKYLLWAPIMQIKSSGTTPKALILKRDDIKKLVRVDLCSEKLRVVTNNPI
jgi:hypothetical protein